MFSLRGNEEAKLAAEKLKNKYKRQKLFDAAKIKLTKEELEALGL